MTDQPGCIVWKTFLSDCNCNCKQLIQSIASSNPEPINFLSHYQDTWQYCNGLDQWVARQQLCQHGPTCNNRGSCFYRVRSDVTQQWIETTWHFSVDPTDAPVDWLDSDQVIYVYCRSISVPQLYKLRVTEFVQGRYKWVVVAEAHKQEDSVSWRNTESKQ
jgi:hypothetical protein